jgi:hypothetical protein
VSVGGLNGARSGVRRLEGGNLWSLCSFFDISIQAQSPLTNLLQWNPNTKQPLILVCDHVHRNGKASIILNFVRASRQPYHISKRAALLILDRIHHTHCKVDSRNP